jgi:hypothetical protein
MFRTLVAYSGHRVNLSRPTVDRLDERACTNLSQCPNMHSNLDKELANQSKGCTSLAHWADQAAAKLQPGLAGD